MTRSSRIVGLVVFAVVAGCSRDVSGPAPVVDDPVAGEALPATPGVVCGDQLTTPVVLRGEGFSPLPAGLTGDPRTLLPDVTLLRSAGLDGAAADVRTLVYSGRPDGANAAKLTWQGQDQLTFVVDQALTAPDGTVGRLEAGLHDVQVANPNGSKATSAKALAVVDKPTLLSLTPPLTCLEQGARTIRLAGETLLRLDGKDAVAVVEGVEAPFALSAFDGCTAIAHPAVPVEQCTSADLVLATSSVPVGHPSVTLLNPASAACSSVEAVRLRVVPAPAISAIEPSLVCTAEGPRDVVLSGTGFLDVDGTRPVVTVGGAPVDVAPLYGCDPLETTGLEVLSCTSASVTLPQAKLDDAQRPEVALANPEPAGCQDATSTELVLVPPPRVDSVDPPTVCSGEGEQVLRVSGAWFLVVDGTKPTVRFDGEALDPAKVTPGSCTALDVPRRIVERCETLDIAVAPSQISGTSATLDVTNPDPAGCSAAWAYEVSLVDPPVIASAEPPLVCTDDDSRTVRLTGTGFLKIGGVLPSVTMNGAAVTSDAVSGCTAYPLGPLADVELCTTLDVTIPQGTLAAGPVAITVSNPDPVACPGTAADVLVAAPPVAVVSADPTGMCSTSPDLPLTLNGTGFLKIDGVMPSVTLGGVPHAVEAMDGCTSLNVPDLEVETCTALHVTVASGSLPVGEVAIEVINAAPSGCAAVAAGVFYVVPVPDVASVAPAAFCTGLGGELTISGSSFSPAARVFLKNAALVEVEASGVVFQDATTLVATFPSGVAAGVWDLEVRNAEGCSDTLPAAVTVHPTPLVFFIDPPVAYNGIAIQATIYTSGLDADAADVRLLGPGGEVEVLAGTSRPGEPNRIAVVLPAGLAPGPWSVQVTSQLGCVGVLEGGLTVTGTLAVAIESVDPAYAWTGRSTSVTIKARQTLGEGEVDFVPTPRAYLNPNPAGTGALATALRAVLRADAKTLTAVVPAGLAVGDYDLIVVNPDGTVGLLSAGVHVTTAPPPVVTGVVPASLNGNAPVAATVQGSGFDAGNVSVSMTCRQPDGTVSAALPATVGASTTTSIDATFPSDQVATGSVCIVTVANADGSSFRYSAVSTKTPAQNLNDWRPAPGLVEPRRALGLAAGRPTPSSRVVYAFGGDGGALAQAKTSVESASVDLFGDLGDWSIQRHALPAPRTFVGAARIGRYVYAVGGHDGTAATDTVLRARILDPLAAPEVVDLSVAVLEDKDQGLAKGLWIYRVSAVFPEGYAGDPGGESLPGEPLVVQLPDVAGLELTLRWDAVPGASAYRVYRTPAPGMDVLDVRLAAVIDDGTLQWSDAGAEASADEAPLPAGSLGTWHSVATLKAPREGAAVAAVPHPTLADAWFLYAFGGRTTGGAMLDSNEFASVLVEPPAAGTKETEAQTVSAFALGASPFGTGRADFGAFLVTSEDVSVLQAGEAWIFLGPGNGAGGIQTTMAAAQTTASGDLGTFVAPSKKAPSNAGYGSGDANGFLFMFGGGGGSATASGLSGELCIGVGLGGCNPDHLPEIRNWNNLGTSLSASRVFPGTCQESAFFFVAGGFDGVGVTGLVDTTVQ